ncbi:serine hydrolase [Piscinibacter aquaticus]|uniref:Serine hydrolase n=1 Tax=Piscinibacter aquaticus TaxID=392597 RepID=A0A5C6TZ57_9BURK|nr:serine hydrolase [Piscinibacter aquaticus]
MLGCAPLGLAAADRCTAPAGNTPGFDAHALCRALPEMAAGDANLHGVLVEQGGQLRVESYFDGWDQPGGSLFPRPASFDATSLHDVRSVTKSVVGLLVGIALERGLVESIERPVLDFFPEHADLRSPERRRSASSICCR